MQMKTIAQLGASPAPWSLNLETCTVVDANDKPVLDNEFGVSSMEDADMNLFLASAGLYECLRELHYWSGRLLETGNDDSDNVMIVAKVNEWREKARAELAKAAGESEV